MGDVEIVALRCPSCGNSSTVPERELRFGYQFTCPYCQTVSVLIINRQLYIPLPGERVCVECGRVAPRGARFCQCGSSLVRKCINPKCFKEFPVDHDICDYCGWPQDVEPSSEAGVKLRVQRAIRDLSNPDPKIRGAACEALWEIGPAAVPALADLIKRSGNRDALEAACWALKEIGPAASEAVPALADLMVRSEDEDVLRAARWALKEIAPAAVPALADLIERSKDKEVFERACWALKEIAPAAVPALADLIGRSRNEGVLRAACWALWEIGPAASEAVPALADLIKRSRDEYVLKAACWVLGRIGEPAALPALRYLTGWFSGVSKEVKEAAREAIREIERRRRGK
jgi:HEAT repeat protein